MLHLQFHFKWFGYFAMTNGGVKKRVLLHVPVQTKNTSAFTFSFPCIPLSSATTEEESDNFIQNWSVTQICGRKQQISVWISVISKQSHCSQLCEDKDTPGWDLHPQVTGSEKDDELRLNRKGGDWDFFGREFEPSTRKENTNKHSHPTKT